MSEGTSLLTHEFPLGAEYRRCGWYVLLGVASALGVTACLKHFGLVRGDGWAPFAICAVVLILAACGLLYAVYHWRIRVDEMGVARRRLWKWDLWTWDEFETGKIVRCRARFRSATRPWWRNELTICVLDEDDRAFVLGACKFFFRTDEEPPVELPQGELLLQYQLFRTVSLREEGIAGQLGRRDFEIDWSEVKEIRLLYFDHWSTELCKIELDLPDRTLRIEGVNKVTGPGFDALRILDGKAIPNVVADFLKRYAPEDKLVRHALNGPPATLAECEHRRRKLQSQLRTATRYYRTVPACLATLTSIWMGPKLFALWAGPAVLPNVAWLLLVTCLTVAMIFSYPAMCWGLIRETRNRHAKALRELDAWEDENIEQDITEDRTLVASH